jgi:AcrR family transcriptional regulator
MSPRPYRLGQRQVLTEQTRERILTVTRELLMTSDGFFGFSIDAVARQADVARMTVYHQFGSKFGLLEALTDVLAAQGGMQQLASAFRERDPLDALDTYYESAGMLWRPEPPDRRRSTYHHPCMFPPQLWNHGNCVRHWEFKHFHVLSGREPFSELHI